MKIKDIPVIALGCAVYGAFMNIFAIPNGIAPGGATGAAMILSGYSGISVGVLVLIINIPLLAVSYKMFGKGFVAGTLVTTAMLSLFLDIFSILPHYSGDLFLCACVSGAGGGAGLALVFGKGVMTGGSDLAAKIIKTKLPFISLGTLIAAVDGVVIIAAAATDGNIDAGLYAAVCAVLCSKVIDSMLLGFETSKGAMVITASPSEVTGALIRETGRTATVLDASGGYTGTNRKMVLCAVRRYQLASLKKAVYGADSEAFIMIFDIGEIYGRGFRRI